MEFLIGYIGDGRASGVDRHILAALGALRGAGHRADLLTSRADPALRARLAAQDAALLEVPPLRRPAAQYRAVRDILRAGRYDAAYFNISEPVNCAGALAARACGTRVVLHSHNTRAGGASAPVRAVMTALDRLAKPVLCAAGDVYLACSAPAGRWLYTARARASGRYHILANAVALDALRFDAALRRRTRAALGLGDACVIGHVGNFVPAKNSLFLPALLRALLPLVPDAVLLSAGDGPERRAVEAKAASLGVAERCLFLGVRDDVPALLQAMDAFVLPSLFEGMPIAALEAQAAGLPVFLSGAVTRETSMGGPCHFLDLRDGPARWAEAIARALPCERLPGTLPPDAARFDAAAQARALVGHLTGGGAGS